MRSHSLAAGILFALLASPALHAQQGTPCNIRNVPGATYQTFYISHITSPHQFSETLTVLRNLLQQARIVSVPGAKAIAVCATPADLDLTQKVISDLDRPRVSYRLTYTLTEMRNGRSAGQKRISALVASGEGVQLKQGIRLPLVTGSENQKRASQQVQYVDVGLNVWAHLEAAADSLQLHTKVEQSYLSPQRSGLGPQDPVLRQTLVTLVPGKPLILGAVDAGYGRTQQVSVTAEPLP